MVIYILSLLKHDFGHHWVIIIIMRTSNKGFLHSK